MTARQRAARQSATAGAAGCARRDRSNPRRLAISAVRLASRSPVRCWRRAKNLRNSPGLWAAGLARDLHTLDKVQVHRRDSSIHRDFPWPIDLHAAQRGHSHMRRAMKTHPSQSLMPRMRTHGLRAARGPSSATIWRPDVTWIPADRTSKTKWPHRRNRRAADGDHECVAACRESRDRVATTLPGRVRPKAMESASDFDPNDHRAVDEYSFSGHVLS